MLLRFALVAFGLGLFGSAHGTELGEVMPPPAKQTEKLRGLQDIWLSVTGLYKWDEPLSVGPEKGGEFLAALLLGGIQIFDTVGLEAGVKKKLEKETSLRVTSVTSDRMSPPDAVVLSVKITLKGKPGGKDLPMDVELNLYEQAQLLRNPAVRLVVSTAMVKLSGAAGEYPTIEDPVWTVVDLFIESWREQNQ